MAIWHSSITRYRVRLNNGIVVAEGLYRLWTTRLLDPCDQHSRIPRGTLVFGCDMKSTAECEDGDLWLSCLDVCRANQYSFRTGFRLVSESPIEVSGGGCCGVNGHVHDAATNEIIGDVFADCYNSHYIKLNAGHFRLEREENGSAVTLVGLVDFEQHSWLVGCASARDFNEAEERLFEICEINMLNEAGHACFCGLSLESLRVYPQLADRFLRDLRGCPIQWFFLKNRPTTHDLGFAC
jgi:hypothetical protein